MPSVVLSGVSFYENPANPPIQQVSSGQNYISCTSLVNYTTPGVVSSILVKGGIEYVVQFTGYVTHGVNAHLFVTDVSSRTRHLLWTHNGSPKLPEHTAQTIVGRFTSPVTQYCHIGVLFSPGGVAP